MNYSRRGDAIPLLGAITLNGGDAAIAIGSATLLSDALNRDVIVFDRDAAVASSHHPELNYSPWLLPGAGSRRLLPRLRQRWRRLAIETAHRPLGLRLLGRSEREILSIISHAPLIAATGGTYLVDQYQWESRLPELEMSLRSKRPLVFMTQSIGPFKRKSASTGRLGAILSEASWIMARDTLTIEVVKDIAPHARVSLIPDMAFYMSSLPEVARIERARRAVRSAPQIGISVRHWTHFRGQDAEIGMHRYLDVVAKTVSQVVRELGAEVSFVSTCQGVPSYPFDDSIVAQEVASLLPSDVGPHVHIDSQFNTPYELIRKFASLDALIATRMHAVILGWLAGTPAVGIAYEPKTKELYDRHGIPALVHNIETVQAADLVDDVVRCLNRSVEEASLLRLRVDQEVSALNHTRGELQRIVESAN